MVIGLIKGILGILGPFYNDGGEESRQPADLRSFPNLEDAVLNPTPITSRTNNL